jgi:acyl carrier protein
MRSPFVREVRAFVVNNFLLGKGDTLTDDASFMELGIIDSTGMLELISYLEKTYEIEVTDDELNPDNLDSISKIVDYLSKKLPDHKAETAAIRQKARSAG